jgi:hypothetical protein
MLHTMFGKVEMKEKYQFYGIVYYNITTSCNTLQLYFVIPELNAYLLRKHITEW